MAMEEPRWEVAFLASSWLIPRFHADFPGFTSKIVEHSRYLLQPSCSPDLVINLKVRRNQPECSNFAFKVRASQNLCGSCRSRGGRCQRTNGNFSYIISSEKYT